MREVEVKVRLHDIGEALEKLAQAGIVVSQPKEQHDVVYCLPEDKTKENDPATNWLRIRTQDKTKVFFTLKRSVSGSLDSIEHETIVENGEELAAMLRYMGYVTYNDLVKIRRTGHYGDSVEICVDEVSPLGAFMELEQLCEDSADGAEIEAQLLAVLDTLGIAYETRVTRGYDELMNEYLARKE